VTTATKWCLNLFGSIHQSKTRKLSISINSN